MRLALGFTLAIGASAISLVSAQAAEFTYSDKTNAEMARRLGIPVFFGVPQSARLPLPKSINTTDRLIEFKHPDAKSTDAGIGLRLIVAKRSGFGKRMAQSGLIQTGDILLTFRPEWGGAGAYPNVQLGVSHTGIAYVKDGVAYQLDNPMDAEYLGASMKGDFSSEHYRTLKYLHIIRPRGLTDEQRANLLAWVTRLNSSARRIYPKNISFNQDYNAPKYAPGKPLEFVHQLGKIALGETPTSKLDMYCSEFVWSILAMRNCSPSSADSFKDSRVPSCVSPAMEPMKATGDYVTRRGRTSNAGLADGPLMVIDALKLPTAERETLLHQVFVENPSRAAGMSSGHKTLAQSMQPKFAPLEEYYKGAAAGGWHRFSAWYISNEFRRALPANYSPTSYIINTMLPSTNSNRTMDYVATVAFE
jgi:hypothetical protein